MERRNGIDEEGRRGGVIEGGSEDLMVDEFDMSERFRVNERVKMFLENKRGDLRGCGKGEWGVGVLWLELKKEGGKKVNGK